MGRVFCHISGGTAILTAQRQTLQQTQADQDDGGCHANAGIGRKNTHDEGRQAHDQDGHQKGVLATDHVAEPAKHQRTEGAHDEASGKSQQGENESGTSVQAAEKLLRNNCGE